MKNKNELIDAVANRCCMKKKEARVFVNTVFDVMTDILMVDDLHIVNLGTFTKYRLSDKHIFRNPKKNIIVDAVPKNTVRFKISDGFLRKLNDSNDFAECAD
ncbi:MAG: HU family DNA-binding protein [Lachnospiraceae bacterium]|nr:HU family DNA-binding protein [Lachnospiraceae bacterium]